MPAARMHAQTHYLQYFRGMGGGLRPSATALLPAAGSSLKTLFLTLAILPCVLVCVIKKMCPCMRYKYVVFRFRGTHRFSSQWNDRFACAIWICMPIIETAPNITYTAWGLHTSRWSQKLCWFSDLCSKVELFFSEIFDEATVSYRVP